METSVSSHPSPLSAFVSPSPSPCRFPVRLQRFGVGAESVDGRGKPSAGVLSFAGSRGRDFEGELVDKNMAVLRKRIHELRRAEEGDDGPPNHWMEWEKRHHGSYNAIVCGAVGMLQSLLLNTRPSVALGVAVLVALSVPASAVIVVLRLAGVIDMILQGGQVKW